MPTSKIKRLTASLISISAAVHGAHAQTPDRTGATKPLVHEEKAVAPHHYVGLWITDDGRVRHELLPNGRYDEARGNLQSAYQGRYVITGTHIEYWDDTGFTADGDFVDANTLHHGGMILRRR
jgi:hypothetical protein